VRAFEQEYRTQLIIYLQSQLHQPDGPRPATPADSLRTQQSLVAPGWVRVVKPANPTLTRHESKSSYRAARTWCRLPFDQRTARPRTR
jgi:hypothetical protein